MIYNALMYVCTGIILTVLSIQDIKKKSLNCKTLLAAAVIIGLLVTGYSLYSKSGVCIINGAVGVLPGILLIIISFATGGQIGKGDGITLMVTGMAVGIYNNIFIILCAFTAAGIFALVLYIIKKKGRYEIPFIPFVLAGYLIFLLSTYTCAV